MVTRKSAAPFVQAFGLAMVLTNSLRSLDWLHPASINVLGFACIGIGAAVRLAVRSGRQKSAD